MTSIQSCRTRHTPQHSAPQKLARAFDALRIERARKKFSTGKSTG